MGRMVFRLSEPKASEIALGVRDPSATDLPARHFFSSFGNGSADITLGAAFAPTDNEIQDFLIDRPTAAHEPMNWVDGTIVADEKTQTTQTSSSDDSETATEEKIASEWLSMRDAHKWSGWNSLERAVFGEVKNGARSVKIKRVVANLQGVDVTNVNAEIERLINSWGTTHSAMTYTTPKNDDFQPTFAA